MNTFITSSIVLILGTLLQGCSSIGVQLLAVAAAEPFLRSSGDICIDSPSEAYAAKIGRCAQSIYPRLVNSPVRSHDGYCALEWALVYDRMDMAQEAISLGADPFKCEKSGLPFFRAFTELGQKYGASRQHDYIQLLKTSNVFRTNDSKIKVAEYGVLYSKWVLELALEIGNPVNAPIYGSWETNKKIENKSLLYLAEVNFLQSPNQQRAELVRLLLKKGAVANPSIETYLDAGNAVRVHPESVATLRALVTSSSEDSSVRARD
jgi:hypothetical protein